MIQAASSGETITLVADIYGWPDHCIEFDGAHDVTFSGGGHHIGGDQSDGQTGVYLTSGSDNNTVRDISNVEEFYHGLSIFSDNNTLTNITASYNVYNGFYIASGTERNRKRCCTRQ